MVATPNPLHPRRDGKGVAKLRREQLARRHEREKALAFKKAEIYEEALANVWRWTNDGYPHLELLLPILKSADADAQLATALDKLEQSLGASGVTE